MADLGTLTDGLFVGFLTIEERERETWAAELAGPQEIGVLERDFGGHVYQETNTSFWLGCLSSILGSAGAKPAIRRAVKRVGWF